MPVSAWSTTANLNIVSGGVSGSGGSGIQGSSSLANGNDAIQEIMAQIATFITAATFTGNITMTSTDADAGLGPILTLDRDSATPAASDLIGQIIFRGEDSAGNDENYSDIYSQIIDPTSTSEDASLFIRTKIAGSMTAILTLSSAGLTVGTGLILPQASAPAPTAEGDMRWDTDDNAIVVGDGASQKIFRQNAWEMIEKGTAAAVATKDFTSLSAYRMLRLTAKVEPATDGVVPWLRTSTDNGSTFAATANDYHIQNVLISNATTTSSAVTNAAQLHLVANNIVGNSSTEGASFVATIFDWNQARYGHFITETFFLDTGGAVNRSINAGQRAQATARDALRFMFSSGNIATMHYVLEGVRG